MQVTVVHAEGAVNESNNLVSIRAANARRQGGLQLGKPLQFPVSVADANPLKINVLRQICVGHETIAAEDSDYRIALEPVGEAAGDAAASAVPQSITLRVKNNIHLCGRSRKEVKAGTSAAQLGCSVSETIADIGFSDVHADIKGGISAVMEARRYFDSHNILRVVRALLEAVIREQPDDPFDFISKFMDGCSKQLCQKSSLDSSCWASKNDTSTRWPNHCCQYPKEWVDTFNTVDVGKTGELEADNFIKAIGQLYPTLSRDQVLALCYGVNPLGKINLAAFCAVATSVEQGEAIAAEAAGLSVEDFVALARCTPQEESERLAAEKEQERLVAESAAKVEADRLASQLVAKQDAEKVEQDTVAAEKEEADRLAAENAAKEKDNIMAAKKDQRRSSAEFAAKIEADRLASEFAAQEDGEKLEPERVAFAETETDRVVAENAATNKTDKLASEKEQERLVAEFDAKVEADRSAAATEDAARVEQERVVAAKAEADRLAAENAAKEKAEKCAAEKEQERLVAEFAAKDRLASQLRSKEDFERLEQEKNAVEKAEANRLAAESAAKESVDMLVEEKEQQRLANEFAAQLEAGQLALELAAKEDAERLEEERIAAEKADADRLAAENAAKEKAVEEEQQRSAAEYAAKVEADRLVSEFAAKEYTDSSKQGRSAGEKAETDRVAAESVEKEDADRLAAERERDRLAAEEAERLVAELFANVEPDKRKHDLLQEQTDAANNEHARLSEIGEKLIKDATVDASKRLLEERTARQVEKALVTAADDGSLQMLLSEESAREENQITSISQELRSVLAKAVESQVSTMESLPHSKSSSSQLVHKEHIDSSALNAAREQMREMLVSAVQDGVREVVREKTRSVLLEALEDGSLDQCLMSSFSTERVRSKIGSSLTNALQDGTLSCAVKTVLDDQVRAEVLSALARALDDATFDGAGVACSTHIKEDNAIIRGQPDEDNVQKEELRQSIQSQLARASVDGSLSELIQEASKEVEAEETRTRQGQDANTVRVPVRPDAPRTASSFVRSAEQNETTRDS